MEMTYAKFYYSNVTRVIEYGWKSWNIYAQRVYESTICNVCVQKLSGTDNDDALTLCDNFTAI